MHVCFLCPENDKVHKYVQSVINKVQNVSQEGFLFGDTESARRAGLVGN